MQFDFGENWKNYSHHALTPKRLSAARQSLLCFLNPEQIRNKKVVDIGCGSGIFSLAFTELGAAQVLGTDVNPKCLSASHSNYQKSEFFTADSRQLSFIQDDILHTNLHGQYDLVYSWGVLHHTGAMYQALDNCLQLVHSGGFFIVALYNRHWSSPIWRIIKYLYNLSPLFIKKIFIILFYLPIMLAKALVTHVNPFRKTRGMDFYYDLVDWLGGYPYEYASISEVTKYIIARGFTTVKTIPAEVPTGCNEFIFIKNQDVY